MNRIALTVCIATLLGASAVAQTTKFVANLDGRQEVPPNMSAATGLGIFYLYEPDNILTYEVTSTGLPAVITGAHIHQAAPGVNGGIFLPFRNQAGPNRWCGSQTITAAQVAAVKAGNSYANLHTMAFPGGEIRGQLINADPGVFVAPMDGGQEVPPVRTSAVGHACFALNPDNSLHYAVTAEGLTATAAHIHPGARGVNGPPLFPFVGGPNRWVGDTGVLTAQQLADLRAGLMYANVHTAANPGGEVRGQILQGTRSTAFGAACRGSGNLVASIGAEGIPCIGGDFHVKVFNAAASIPAILAVSTGAAGSPIDMGGIGAPGCLFHLDPLGLIFFFFVPTDSLGCASADLSPPYDRSLLNVAFYLQWLLIDRGANPGGVVASNALKNAIQ